MMNRTQSLETLNPIQIKDLTLLESIMPPLNDVFETRFGPGSDWTI